jgi:2-polyprenyl-6-methoxyphenol hydroxylase-like FAD-dependent oxidoreductase
LHPREAEANPCKAQAGQGQAQAALRILPPLLKCTMPELFDVCIRGSGPVGRTLALLLARERLRVALVDSAAERAAPAMPASDVRAFALNSASRRLLDGLRAWPGADAVTPVEGMQVWSDSSAALPQLAFDTRASGEPALAWIVDAPALEQRLAQATQFQPQIETVGAPVAAALQVVCEGPKSASRDAFGASWTVRPYPQKAIAARLLSSVPHGGVARQWFNRGEILALLPMGGAGGRQLALVWSVAVERAEALCALADADFCAALQADCGPLPGMLTLDGPRASWPLALSTADRWVGPGWALAGDAAHTVHPLAGQGLNLGLADAAELAAVLGRREYWRSVGDEKLLRRYERARKGDAAALGLVTDQLHGLFAHTDARWQALRQWGVAGFAKSGPLKAWVTRRAAGL